MTDRIPPPIMRSATANMTMGELIDRQSWEKIDKGSYLDDTCEWLLGARVPPFQRPAVWTQQQQIRFIESAWSGIHLGIYVVNKMNEWKGDHIHYTDSWLIDGQQRLRAIKAYLDSEFPVFGLLYKDLHIIDERRFSHTPFACSIIQEKDEAKLRTLYDTLNFGGTAHTEDQRATAPENPKSRALKVFGGCPDGRNRVVMATTSLTAFCKATGCRSGYVSETGNQEELYIALTNPGTIFRRSVNSHQGDAFFEWKPR